jgi:hypothetical protein
MVIGEEEARQAATALIMQGAARVAAQRAENARIGGSELAASNWQQIAQVIEWMHPGALLLAHHLISSGADLLAQSTLDAPVLANP